MNKKRLFVARLPWSIDDEKLKNLFATFGNIVSAKVIVDRDTNRSKGFGFVEFTTEAEAENARAGLNESEVEGRKILVNVAKPQENNR